MWAKRMEFKCMCILKKCGQKETDLKDFFHCFVVTEVSPTFKGVAMSQNALYIFIRHTPPHNIVSAMLV